MRHRWPNSVTAETYAKPLLIFLFAVAVFRLLLGLNLPVVILPAEAADDGLYMRLATNLAAGHWLGPYDQNTLVKGPGYPAFLAVTGLSGLPLSAANGLFELFALTVTAWATFRLTGSRAIGALTFLVLALHPDGFVPGISRVFRDQIYWAQTLLVFSLFVVILYAPPRSRTAAIALSGVAGVLLGWAWLSREESVWFLPGLGLLILGAAAIHRRDAPELRAVALRTSLAAAASVTLIAAFMTANLVHYGAFVGIEQKERNFVSALDALQDVDAGPIKHYVPVPLAARTAVAKISPTFKPLNEALANDGPLSGWERLGCKIYVHTCGEIAGSFFMWAFRDAAAIAGFYEDPGTAALNFGKIANEIAAACSDGRLTCRRRWFSHVPAMTNEQLASLPHSLEAVAGIVLFPFPGAPYETATAPSEVRSDEFAKYWTFLNQPFATALSNVPTTVRGWYRDSSSTEWPAFNVYASDRQSMPFSLERQLSPDLQQHFSEGRLVANRYVISFDCPNVCSIVAISLNRPELRVTVDRDRAKAVSADSATLFVDSVSYGGNATGAANPTKKFAARLRAGLVRLYQTLHPLLVITGLAAMVLASGLALAARALNPTLLVAAAAWALIATRIVILALIDLSSFPAADPNYSAPATYLAVLAAVLSIAAVANQLWSSRAEPRDS